MFFLRATVVGLGVLACVGPRLVEAQSSLLDRVGHRVRLTTVIGSTGQDAGAQRWTGVLSELRGDTLVLVTGNDGSRRTIHLKRVRLAEGSLGKFSRGGRGALLGALVGAGVGTATGLIVCGDDTCDSSGGSVKGPLVGAFGVGGALVGAGVGLLVGTLIKTERWEVLGIPLRVGLGSVYSAPPTTPHAAASRRGRTSPEGPWR